jgi:transcriptional regulator with XRE-family HTH domain
MMNINVAVAAELRAHRARKKLTQAQVAETLGCDPATVARWENGKVPMTLDGLQEYAAEYGTTVSALVHAAGW